MIKRQLSGSEIARQAIRKIYYNFSNDNRGKFYRKNATPAPPINLSPDILSHLSAHADAQGASLRVPVNPLLKKDIELIELAK